MQPAARFTVKASLGSEIRRFNLERCEFSVLKETCMNVFSMPSGSAPVFKYTDDENDVVTISSTAELAEAFRVHPEVLRIAVDVIPFAAPRKPAFKPAPPVAAASVVTAPPAAAAPTAPAASNVPAAAPVAASPAPAPAPVAAAAVPAAPAPAPIHSTANTEAPAPAANSSSSSARDDELTAARSELSDIRSRFQSTNDKSLKAQLRPQLLAAKGRVLALHVAAKTHKTAMQMERKQARVAIKRAEKEDKHFAKAEKKSEKAEEKAEKKAQEKPASADAPVSRGLKEQMLLGRFVRDVTIPDGFEMDGGRAFVKTWRFRNDSTRPWSAGTRLLFVGKNSDRMGALDSLPITAVLQPGEECDVSVSLTSPAEPGRYTAYFRLADAAGRKFGQRVWVQIQVTADSSSESDKESAKEAQAPAVPAAGIATASLPALNKKVKPAFEPSPEELAKYGAHLRTLGSMGFLNTKRNLRLLNKFAGNLDRTVEVLLRKPEKNKPQATA